MWLRVWQSWAMHVYVMGKIQEKTYYDEGMPPLFSFAFETKEEGNCLSD